MRDLAMLAAEIQSRAHPDPGGGDDDPGKIFQDRAVRLQTTFQGAGVLSRGSGPRVRRGHGPGCAVRTPRRGG